MTKTIKFYLIIFVIFLLTSCSAEKKKEQTLPIEKTEKQQTAEKKISPGESADKAGMQKFSLVSHSAEGKKEWEITGDKAVFLSDNKIKLDNVRAETSREENTLVMVSKQGFFDKKSKDVFLEENVKGVWTQGKNTTTITCDGPLEIDNLKKRAIFKENVVVLSEEGKIFADKIEVFFNEEDKKIIQIIATGNVRIEREGNKSNSEKAIYFAEQKKIVLTGKPQVEIWTEEKY